MAIVTGLTKDRMLAIEAASVTNGVVDAGGDLILTKKDGSQINAGHVRGADGADATALLGTTDSPSIDFTLEGAGTPEDPWELSADVKVLAHDRLPNLTVTGLLAHNYRGPGPASVRIDGDPIYTSGIDWAVPYIPWGSRRVTLSWFGSKWVIIGQTQYETVDGGHKNLSLTLATNWKTYNETVAETNWAEPRVTQLPSKLVVLSGLIRFVNGVPAADSVIAQLPAGMRPEFEIIHYVNNSDSAKALSILPNGNIVVRTGSYASNGYISLDGIAFWPAGSVVWTLIGAAGSGTSFGANFEAQAADTLKFGAPAFYKDVYGFVWFRGVVRVKTQVTLDNTPIFVLPSNLRSKEEQHFRTTSNDGYGGLGCRPTDGLNWKPNTIASVGGWISLASVMIATTDAVDTLNVWDKIESFANTWAVHAGAFPIPATSRRGDGLSVSKGLITGTSLGVGRAFTMKRETWPDQGRLIMDGIGTNARTRLDISGPQEEDRYLGRTRGGVSIVNGGTSGGWYSLDSLKWASAT